MKMRKISIVGSGADEPVRTRMSRRSVIGTMDKFVQAVDNMNETVMVPSLLMDMSLSEDDQQQPTSASSSNTDMHAFYSLLNSVKTELLYGMATLNNNNNNGGNLNGSRAPSRRMSSASSVSTDSSDTDFYSESLVSDSDFSNLDLDEQPFNCTKLTKDFKHHLSGLCRSLKQLTTSADTLTTRYKVEVEN